MGGSIPGSSAVLDGIPDRLPRSGAGLPCLVGPGVVPARTRLRLSLFSSAGSPVPRRATLTFSNVRLPDSRADPEREPLGMVAFGALQSYPRDHGPSPGSGEVPARPWNPDACFSFGPEIWQDTVRLFKSPGDGFPTRWPLRWQSGGPRSLCNRAGSFVCYCRFPDR